MKSKRPQPQTPMYSTQRYETTFAIIWHTNRIAVMRRHQNIQTYEPRRLHQVLYLKNQMRQRNGSLTNIETFSRDSVILLLVTTVKLSTSGVVPSIVECFPGSIHSPPFLSYPLLSSFGMCLVESSRTTWHSCWDPEPSFMISVTKSQDLLSQNHANLWGFLHFFRAIERHLHCRQTNEEVASSLNEELPNILRSPVALSALGYMRAVSLVWRIHLPRIK